MIFAAAAVAGQSLTVKEIMAEPSIAGMRAQSEQLSPDGKWVVFLWSEKGVPPLDLYIVSTSGGAPRKWLSSWEISPPKEDEKKDEDQALEYGVVVNDDFARARRNQFGNLRWSPDSSKLLFSIAGDLYVIGTGEEKPRRITKTESSEFAARFLTESKLLFQQNGDIFTLDLSDGSLVQLSKEADRQKNISIGGVTVSDDGSMAAYSTSDGSGQRALFVPNYLPYYTAAPSMRRGWTKQELYVTKTDGSLDKSVKVELPKPEGESYFYGIEWTAGNKYLIVDRVDKTHKRRQIFAVTIGDGKTTASMIHEETDEKWIGGPARILDANPSDPSRFAFGSEKDGWHHLYSAEISGEGTKAAISQITKGNWQVEWAEWAADGSTVSYLATTESPRWRTLYSVDPRSGETKKIDPQTVAGMHKTGVEMESGKVVFEASNVITPGELYVVDTGTGTAAKLTSTIPDDYSLYRFKSPSFTEVTARDGKKVPVKFYLPDGFSKSRKYPMAIFVHGAGYLQNVINGWNNYYREFMFNEMLRRKGYVVLDIDYRGSAGYGRDWRTDVYDFLGGTDYTDHLDAIEHMIKEYSVDPARIGAYGGSYGGFMAAMLVMRAPDRIAAAAALRPVMDWKNYYAANPFYTSQRLGDPKKNPEAYKRSSPISYAAELRSKLLILHGLVDSNVHAQDSIQLAEQLIRLDKTEHFEMMLYPAENHGFERSASWEDEYERILALFERELN